MTTDFDFRALCAELVDSIELLLEMRSPNAGRMWTTERRLRVARAALADEPAVPKGREPAAVTEQPSDEDLLLSAAYAIEPCHIRWGNPAPQPPAAEAVLDAATERWLDVDDDIPAQVAAAALRAAADQVVPEPPAWEIGVLASADREIEIRHEILAIATELEAGL